MEKEKVQHSNGRGSGDKLRGKPGVPGTNRPLRKGHDGVVVREIVAGLTRAESKNVNVAGRKKKDLTAKKGERETKKKKTKVSFQGSHCKAAKEGARMRGKGELLRGERKRGSENNYPRHNKNAL